MTGTIRRKWRPTLGQVVFLVLATVLALPLVGLFFFRLYENQLVRETEAELIAQSAAIAAIFAHKVEVYPQGPLPLGKPVIREELSDSEPFRPIRPSLDIAGDRILGMRPEAREVAGAPAASYVAIGSELGHILRRTQETTLAGFRLLDPTGIVIAGRDEIGQSLAHIEEIADALSGNFQSVLRIRISDRPTPPLYSLSRSTGVRVFTAMPVIVNDHVAGVVYASRTPDNIVKHIYAEKRKYIFAALVVLAVTLVIGVLFLRLITRPVHALVRRAGEVGRPGNEPQPIRHYGTREIALLAESFDEMASRLKERSDYIATFAAHVSHELKTPLTSIQGAAELLRDESDAPSEQMSREDRNRFLDNIVADTTRLAAILHRLRELARADNQQMTGASRLSDIINDMRSAFPEVMIETHGYTDQSLPISRENLMIVLAHLVDNAARHNAGIMWLGVEADDQFTRISVEDDGDGISEKNREQIFDAFFTTRRESGGIGMGLRIVQAMLTAHDGSIKLKRSKAGAAFEIVLPRV